MIQPLVPSGRAGRSGPYSLFPIPQSLICLECVR